MAVNLRFSTVDTIELKLGEPESATSVIYSLQYTCIIAFHLQ